MVHSVWFAISTVDDEPRLKEFSSICYPKIVNRFNVRFLHQWHVMEDRMHCFDLILPKNFGFGGQDTNRNIIFERNSGYSLQFGINYIKMFLSVALWLWLDAFYVAWFSRRTEQASIEEMTNYSDFEWTKKRLLRRRIIIRKCWYLSSQ